MENAIDDENQEVLNRVNALMDKFYSPQISENNNHKIPTLTEFISEQNQIENNTKNIPNIAENNSEQQEFMKFLNKRLYAEISGILKILIPNLTEKIYKEFLLSKNKNTNKNKNNSKSYNEDEKPKSSKN